MRSEIKLNRRELKQKLQTLEVQIQALEEANGSEEKKQKARVDLKRVLKALDVSNPFRDIDLPNYHRIAEYLNNKDKFDLLQLCLLEKPEQVEEKKYDVLKWLFMSGAMDACRLQHAQIQANPVVYDNCEKDGESTMSIAATDAHMVLMKELLEVYEDDGNCNTITSNTNQSPALPWTFNDENMTKIVKVAVRDEIGLSESVDTFYSIRVDR